MTAPAAKRIALTFDDGPSEWTLAILDVLSTRGAHATFFVIGEAIAGREEILRRTAAEGHEIGNHTWSHPQLSELADEEIRDELSKTSDEIERVVRQRPRLFRPPYFDFDTRVERIAAEAGFSEATLYTSNPNDWALSSVDEIVKRVVRPDIHHRTIVDLHDGRPLHDPYSTPSRQPTVDALARIVPALLHEGYELVTVSELRGN